MVLNLEGVLNFWSMVGSAKFIKIRLKLYFCDDIFWGPRGSIDIKEHQLLVIGVYLSLTIYWGFACKLEFYEQDYFSI